MFNQISFLEKLLFTKHLTVMIKSGIPLAEALTLLKDQTTTKNLKRLLEKVCDQVDNGKKFSEALEQFPSIFDELYLSLVRVGEESGNLEVTLGNLSDQLQKDYEFKKKVRSAMLYPSFVIVMAIVLGGGIAIFVLPQLMTLFASLDIDLPTSTKILMAIANFMKVWGFVVVPGTLLGFGLFSWITHKEPFKNIWDRIVLKIPVIGGFVKNAQVATFCRNLGLMIKSGFPLNKGLIVVKNGMENDVFKEYVAGIALAVEGGRTIESELNNKKYSHFPVIVGKMVGVGERTGKLDETLSYLGDFFAEEVDGMAKNLPTILEPILLTAIAGIVAFIALAIISPIYQFTSSIHR